MSSNEFVAPKVIAEIGCNHKGDMEIAKELIKLSHAVSYTHLTLPTILLV